jgi:aldose sugar dehydrogenase
MLKRRLALGLPALLATTPAMAQIVDIDRDPPLNVSFRLVAVAEPLEHPWSIAFLPDGTMLVTERPGRLRAIRGGRLDPTPIAGVPRVLVASERGLIFQSGLFEVLPHPGFAQNRTLFISYAAGTPQENRLVVARATFTGTALEDVRVIWQARQAKPEFQHYGGRLAWMPDGTLLVGVGDGGNPPIAVEGRMVRDFAQDRGSHFGKIVRIREDGQPAPGNPFAGQQGALADVFSLGHRHIQGIAVDAANNRIWATEHGPLGADELNLITAGGNYGWPVATHGTDYVGATQISTDRTRTGMADPVLLWSRTVAPSGLALYTGDRFPGWRGNLFSGSLAYQDVRRIMLDATGRPTGHESLRIGQRVRDVRQGPDGFLYVLTDEIHGRVFRMEPA